MAWFNLKKLQLDEIRVAWAFCVAACVISYFELF